MSVRIGCGLSTQPDPRLGAMDAARAARDGLRGERADLVCVFMAGAHLATPDVALEAIHHVLEPDQLIGCGAGGVIGDGREVEHGTGISVWAASLGDGRATTFRAESIEMEEGVAVGGMPDLDGASGLLLLPDPYSFPTDGILAELGRTAPTVPVLGGVPSGRLLGGGGALFLGTEIVGDGAVGVRFDGLEVLPCVSQGAAPVGPELTVTAAEGPVIHELAGRPALETVRAVIGELPRDQQALLSRSLLVGLVVDTGKPEYVQGDFLVRAVLGLDQDTGTIAVGATVEPGQIVRLHARDAESAQRDLREALALRRLALGGEAPAGALLFTCNGRGEGMFGVPDHDATTLDEALGGAPAAGFFAAGEIGPVGGEPFQHGFTATVAVFPA